MRPILLTLCAIGLITGPASAGADVRADKATAARVLTEKMGRGDFSRLDEIYAPGFVAHAGGRQFTLEDDNASARAIRAAAPDLKVSVLRLIGEEPFVTVHWAATGTNTFAAAGMPGQGRRVSVEGMTIFRFERGRIVEEWSLTDQLSMMRQLGLLPSK